MTWNAGLEQSWLAETNQRATGGGSSNAPTLTALEERVTKIIGKDICLKASTGLAERYFYLYIYLVLIFLLILLPTMRWEKCWNIKFTLNNEKWCTGCSLLDTLEIWNLPLSSNKAGWKHSLGLLVLIQNTAVILSVSHLTRWLGPHFCMLFGS